MKPDLMEILCCPVCRGTLELTATERSSDGKEIVTGSLSCKKCPHAYPITEGIPNLLPPDGTEAEGT